MPPTALLLAVALAACSPGPTDTLERIRREGVIRVGYANEAPYAYHDHDTDRLTGEAPEIARHVLRQMGISRVEGVLTEFGSLIPGLQAKRFDLIAAGMYITPARCEQIAFSEPTYCMGGGFLVQAGNPLGLRSYEDVARHPSARLGVMAGAVELTYARATGIPEQRVVIFPDAPSAVEGVLAGRVDAFAATRTTIRDLLGRSGERNIESAEPFTDPVIDGKPARGCGAFGFRKEDQQLREEFNRHLTSFLGSASHREMVQPFGFTEAELPLGVTTIQLCQP